MRRSLRGNAREGQSNKKCSVFSIPSFVGHIRADLYKYVWSVVCVFSTADLLYGLCRSLWELFNVFVHFKV